VHNGNGHGMRHGNGPSNGKRWLLIGLLILGGFWLVSDAYSDGFRDALIQTGSGENARFYRGGPDFPWELLILGGIGYVAWRKGAFDRLGGPGGPFGSGNGNGERGVQRYGEPAQGAGPVFRGPRAFFEEWHRESHEAQRARYAAPAAPQAAPAPQASAAEGFGDGVPGGGYTPTPPPPPPTPDYWASMPRAAGAAGEAGNGGAPIAAPPVAQDGSHAETDGPRGATGPALERW
jgi:hypothetical protein